MKVNWTNWEQWKSINGGITDSHYAYIKAQYNSIEQKHSKKPTNTNETKEDLRKKVYECVNLWGLHDLCPIIEFDSPAITAIYEIEVLNPVEIQFD